MKSNRGIVEKKNFQKQKSNETLQIIMKYYILQQLKLLIEEILKSK
jgi:hypothetical protein